MTVTALFALTFLGGRRLGEISGIALVLLIVLVFMILARWQRHRSR
jgi:cytochrome oxidase assembly protein ShyY1